MTLYSMRSPDIITKFDRDGNVESSYHCTGDTCDCPAGQRPTCRHRQMWPVLQSIIDTHWFLDWDSRPAIVDFAYIPKSHYDKMADRFIDTALHGDPNAKGIQGLMPSKAKSATEVVLETHTRITIALNKSWRRI